MNKGGWLLLLLLLLLLFAFSPHPKPKLKPKLNPLSFSPISLFLPLREIKAVWFWILEYLKTAKWGLRWKGSEERVGGQWVTQGISFLQNSENNGRDRWDYI